MEWFQGSIPEAISEAKRIKGFFIVYIYDNTEASNSSRALLDNENVMLAVMHLKYVAINIENGSTEAIQFSQIYPLVVVPSLFFISGETGVPVEIIGGSFDQHILQEKVKKVTHSNLKEVSNSAEEKDTQLEKPERKSDPISSNTAQPNVEEGATANDQTQGTPSKLEKGVERANKLLEQKREMKNLQEIEDEKKNELERRRRGQDVAKVKQQRDQDERTEFMNQRRKDKEEERIARERVKAQIAADRAEKQAREAILKAVSPELEGRVTSQPQSVPTAERSCDITRIKFRFPDDTSDLAQFPPSASLADVRNYLRRSSSCRYNNFTLVAALHQMTFTPDQNSSTLEELGLCPSAIIIVKPLTDATPSRSVLPSTGGLFGIFWTLVAPLMDLLNYLKSLLGFGKRRSEPSELSDEEETQAPKMPRTEGSSTTRNRPKTAYGTRKGSLLRKEGNIHRFHNAGDDDDDENNTWNGNSTQQM